MTRTWLSFNPMAPETNRRMKCGFWLDIQIVSFLSNPSNSAITPRGSIGTGASRFCRMRSLTTTSASLKAASVTSGPVYVRSQQMLSAAPSCASGLPLAMAFSVSITAGSSAYSTWIRLAASAAWPFVSASTAATISPW